MDMRSKRIVCSRAAVALIGAGALLITSGLVHADSTPVYKCRGKNSQLIYTDQPCVNGEQLEIHPGDAGPAAAARLQVDREQLARGAAARSSELKREAAERRLGALVRAREQALNPQNA